MNSSSISRACCSMGITCFLKRSAPSSLLSPGTAAAKGVNTGTDALVITLRALGIGNGDEVIAPANTFHATVAAIELAGAIPVLVDAEEESFLMDESQLPASLGTRTRAIIPVHLFGKPARMPDVMAIAEEYGVEVIEDAAQAHGAVCVSAVLASVP